MFLGNVAPDAAGIHLPFWILVPIAIIVVATFGALLGAPTLRLRGDYLAIVTLGFGEIVPLVFKNLSQVTFSLNLGPLNINLNNANLTGGVQGINPVDPPFLPFFNIRFDARSRLHARLSRHLPAPAGHPRRAQPGALADRTSLDGHPRG